MPESRPPPAGHYRINLNVPSDLYHTLKHVAVDQHRSMTDVVLDAIRDALDTDPAVTLADHRAAIAQSRAGAIDT